MRLAFFKLHCISSINLFILLLIFQSNAQARDIAPRSFMFTAGWDPTAINVVEEIVQEEDFAGPPVQKKQKRATPFSLSSSISKLKNATTRGCPEDGRYELIVYNPEEWEYTPIDEQRNLSSSIKQASDLIHKKYCFKFGIAPSGIAAGRQNCKANPSSLARNVDWSNIDVFIIQAQGMLSPKCGGSANSDEYKKFIFKWAQTIRPFNKNIKIMAHLSFRHSSPEVMISAINKTRDIVDGYYIAYPKIEGIICPNCTPANLIKVIKEIKGCTPANKSKICNYFFMEGIK